MCKNVITPPSELFEFFKKRTMKHIDLVYRNMMRFAIDTTGNFKSEIEARAGFHDSSKLDKPEMPGFIWLTAYYWLQQQNPNIEYTKDSDKQIQNVRDYMNATNNHLDLNNFASQLKEQFKISFDCHYANNPHHPEYHKNISDMSQLDLIEMVCDWTAMSQELKQDNGSARGWADKVIGSRFEFSNPQIAFIYAQIAYLDEQNKKTLFVCKRR